MHTVMLHVVVLAPRDMAFTLINVLQLPKLVVEPKLKLSHYVGDKMELANVGSLKKNKT